MCGIVGFWDKTGELETATGRVILTMLEALACRGPDGAGVALIGPDPGPGADVWSVRITPPDETPLAALAGSASSSPGGTIPSGTTRKHTVFPIPPAAGRGREEP